MNKTIKELDLKELLELYQVYDSDKEHHKFIEKAYDYAKQNHKNKLHFDNEPLINHLLRVAIILTTLECDHISMAATLLHELINEDQKTYDELESLFGVDVAILVDGVSKISRLNFGASTESMIQSQRKIFVGLAKDPRVIIIKVADRLDNMRHLDYLPIGEQKQKAKETLEILIPIAHRLGLNTIKSELEDLSLKYSKREAYDDVMNKLNKTKDERDKAVNQMKNELIEILEANHLNYQIKGRSKSIFSIFKKLDKGRPFSDIYDLLALRILIEKESDCYLLIGLIHSKYKYIPSRFKDFIAMPKNNMYQSIHTTIWGHDGNMFEIQIRTYEMDEIAERGIASHWSYKEQGKSNKVLHTMEQKLEVFRSIIETNEENINPNELLEAFKEELTEDIYVYTPNGDVVELPKGSTPVDFAFKVHTQVGEAMIGAIVNNNIVPLSYELESGDIIKINTTKNSNGPKLEWLNYAKTSQAKNKIKAFFAKNEKENCITKGELSLQKELRRKKIEFSVLNDNNIMAPVFKELKTKDLEDLYHAIGSNRITSGIVINTISGDSESKDDLIIKKVMNAKGKEIVLKNDIVVEGIDDIKVTLSKCCMPIKGDAIVGYITKGEGISVHRANCPNIAHNDRIIDVSWNPKTTKKYKTVLLIEANKTDNGLINIINRAAIQDINIDSVNTTDKINTITYELTVLTFNANNLDKYIANIYSLPFVDKVERIIK
ncbi:MAG: RelA/SpoT family protein [Bacilli bacterium]|nr:RelA/SpoT family protein [Bacilli bacterium]